jgi:hypothetical protein
MKAYLLRKLRAFYDETDGVVTLEAIIYAPMLLGLFMMMITLFDAFHTNNLSQKAAYAIADAISRETTPVDDDFIDGMESLYQLMTHTNAGNGQEYGLRITVISRSPTSNDLEVDWSELRGTTFTREMQTSDVAGQSDNYPMLQTEERVILVESTTKIDVPGGLKGSEDRAVSQVTREPRFSFDDFTMNAYVFSRPRFAPQVCWERCS